MASKVPKFPRVPRGPVLPKHPVVPRGVPSYFIRPYGAIPVFSTVFANGPWKGRRAYMPTGFETMTLNIGGQVGRYIGDKWVSAQ